MTDRERSIFECNKAYNLIQMHAWSSWKKYTFSYHKQNLLSNINQETYNNLKCHLVIISHIYNDRKKNIKRSITRKLTRKSFFKSLEWLHMHIEKGQILKLYIYLIKEKQYKMDAKMKENFASRPGLKLLLC